MLSLKSCIYNKNIDILHKHICIPLILTNCFSLTVNVSRSLYVEHCGKFWEAGPKWEEMQITGGGGVCL